MDRPKRRLINKLMFGALKFIKPDNTSHIKLRKDEVELLYELLPDAEVEFVMSCEFCDDMLTKLGVEERFT